MATLVTRRVCHTCNTGWMAQLEDRARPILMPLIQRRRVTSVPGTDAILAATWGVKTAMTLATVRSIVWTSVAGRIR